MTKTPGEKALLMVAEMLLDSWDERKRLHDAGWQRVTSPPLVNNEWIWFSPDLNTTMTQSEALRWLD